MQGEVDAIIVRSSNPIGVYQNVRRKFSQNSERLVVSFVITLNNDAQIELPMIV